MKFCLKVFYLFGLATLAQCLSKSLAYSDNLDHLSSQNPKLKTHKVMDIFVEQTQCWKDDDSTEPQTFDKSAEGQQKLFKCVKQLNDSAKLSILVTGGAGFVGSHLVDSLMLDGHQVTVLDNFFTGRKSNVEHWFGHPNFELVEGDVTEPFGLRARFGQIYHLASPASPAHYLSSPIKTIRTNTIGTLNMLELAKNHSARMLLASTSEVYGDPQIHPQSESYWGHVNPIGPRACYDESKRVSESMAIAYHSKANVSIGIARIFNTYGPRMHPDDGRVVSNFISQALGDSPLTVYGSGNQTRSFQYVSDLVVGLKKLMASKSVLPVNLGNPQERTIYSLAEMIRNRIPKSKSMIVLKDLPTDDPHRRRPDISRASEVLDWKPVVSFEIGLEKTLGYFTQELNV